MRKLALICAAVALVTSVVPASAQDDFAKNRFGFMGGVNAATLGGLSIVAPAGVTATTPRRWGLQLGGVYERSIGAFGFLRIEPKYIQKGTKVEIGSDKGTAKLDYIDVPIMLRSVYFQKRDWAVHPLVQVGVGPNFLLSAKDENGNDFKSEFKSLEWGLTAAFGVTGKMGNAEWTLDFRLLSSLSRIDDSNAKDKVKNSSMGAAFSVTFPIGQ